jgi:hypothetical protein
MCNESVMPVVLVNRNTGNVYEHLHGNSFKNLTTSKVGELTPQKAKAGLVLPVKLNYLVDKNPALLGMIRELGLSVGLNGGC